MVVYHLWEPLTFWGGLWWMSNWCSIYFLFTPILRPRKCVAASLFYIYPLLREGEGDGKERKVGGLWDLPFPPVSQPQSSVVFMLCFDRKQIFKGNRTSVYTGVIVESHLSKDQSHDECQVNNLNSKTQLPFGLPKEFFMTTWPWIVLNVSTEPWTSGLL